MKIREEDVRAAIAGTKYYYDETLTICVVTTKTGFKVVGESACVDPLEYDQKLGESLALSRAVSKLWAFMGFELASQMYAIGAEKQHQSYQEQAGLAITP